MIIGYRGVFSDYFHGHEVAAISLKALSLRKGFDDSRQLLGQFIPLKIEHPSFAGVRIKQLRVGTRWRFNRKTVKTEDYVHLILNGRLFFLGRTYKRKGPRVQV